MDNVVPMSNTPDAPAATPTGFAPASPVATPQAIPAFAAATPAAPVAAPTAAPEDRSNWVPPHRIREVREGLQRQFAQQQAQQQAQIEQYQNQLRALVGAQPPPNPQIDEVKQAFSQVFGPKSISLFDKAEQIESLLERLPEIESAINHIWGNHGRQSMDRIFHQAEEALGSPLSQEGKQALLAAFSGWVQSSPEYTQRYTDDPTLVDEFWRTLSSTLVDPARRSAAAI